MKAAVLKSFGSPLVIETCPGSGARHRRGHRRCRRHARPVLHERGLQRRAQLRARSADHPGPRRHRPGARDRPGRDQAQRSATGCSATRRCARATMSWRPISPCRARRAARPRRHAPAAAFSPRLVCRADARADREREAPWRDHVAKKPAQWCALGTVLVPYGGFLAANLQAWRDRAGERGHRQFRQRRRLGRAGDGRGLRGDARPQRDRCWPTSSAASARG